MMPCDHFKVPLKVPAIPWTSLLYFCQNMKELSGILPSVANEPRIRFAETHSLPSSIIYLRFSCLLSTVLDNLGTLDSNLNGHSCKNNQPNELISHS